jgi:hypothetical protein
MNADELYTALSERITADAMGHETNKWPDYYNGLRDLIRRVVTESTESGSIRGRERRTHRAALEVCLSFGGMVAAKTKTEPMTLGNMRELYR